MFSSRNHSQNRQVTSFQYYKVSLLYLHISFQTSLSHTWSPLHQSEIKQDNVQLCILISLHPRRKLRCEHLPPWCKESNGFINIRPIPPQGRLLAGSVYGYLQVRRTGERTCHLFDIRLVQSVAAKMFVRLAEAANFLHTVFGEFRFSPQTPQSSYSGFLAL